VERCNGSPGWKFGAWKLKREMLELGLRLWLTLFTGNFEHFNLRRDGKPLNAQLESTVLHPMYHF
jgi:hypothetical protein